MPTFMINIFRHVIIVLLVLVLGFAFSSNLVHDASRKIIDKIMIGIEQRLYHHITTLGLVDAKHYFVIPPEGYGIELCKHSLSLATLAVVCGNSIFNLIFQPVFFCSFTPQAILNIIFFPFFLYGAVRYFKKTWIMLIIFIALSCQIGMYDSAVEALIRHGMSCELIYLLISTAGFAGWITKSS